MAWIRFVKFTVATGLFFIALLYIALLVERGTFIALPGPLIVVALILVAIGLVTFFIFTRVEVVESPRLLAERLKQNEQELAKQRSEVRKSVVRLQASINSLSVGFIMTDGPSSIILINEAALKIFHQHHQHFTTHVNDQELATIETFAQVIGEKLSLQREIDQCLATQRARSFQKVPFGPLFVDIFITPILSDKQAIGTVILLENVTERIMLERSKDEFFSIASHELRTPLTAIQGNAALIKDYYKDELKNKDLAEMIDDIHTSSKRLIGIVNDYLNVSRLEQGRIEFVKEEFDLARVIKKVIEQLQTSADQKKLTLINKVSSTPITTLADPGRTEEVLINLVGNAVKYTDKGSVTLALETGPKTVTVLVSDTGRGIPQESQGSLFRKFQQAANNIYVRDASKSTGLGLYISKLLIEGMGGKIALAHSEIGRGTTFSFELPLISDTTTVRPVKSTVAKMANRRV